MEVGDELVDDLVLVARVDEDPGAAAASRHHVAASRLVPHRRGLYGPSGGGTYRNDAPAGRFGLVDGGGSFIIYIVFLKMHVVVFDFVHLHRAESSDAHVERDVRKLHAARFGRAQKLLGEMQACRGRGHRALHLGVDRLIAVFVFGVICAGDVWRKRHLADLLQAFHEDAIVLELHDPGAVVGVADDGGAEHFVLRIVGLSAVRRHPGEHHGVAYLKAPAGANQGLPAVLGPVACQPFAQKELYLGAGALLHAEKARRQHLGIVQHQAVAGLQVLQYVIKMPVLDAPVAHVNDHEAALVALGRRHLGDELLG